MPTGLDIVTDAYIETGIISGGGVLSAEDATIGLNKVNRILDNWNADRRAVYNVDFLSSFVLTPNLSPHTIGIAANAPTFVVTVNRPESIQGANIILNNITPNVKTPLKLVTDAWWLHQPVPSLKTSLPTYLYYSPGWPNGSLYLWPVPTLAYGLELLVRTVLGPLTLVSTFSLPPGYQDAITLTLAEDLVGGLLIPMPASLPAKALQARARVFDANDEIPYIATRDSGMPRQHVVRSRWNYRNRMNN